MNDPDYGIISDVDPDLSGDPPYTTLQGWYEDTYGETEIQHARCHHSEAADLGELDTSTQTWVYAPTAEEPVCIYAADGDEADGSQDDQLQGAAIVVDGASFGIETKLGAVRIAGLRLTATVGGQNAIVVSDSDSVLIERCTVIFDDVQPGEGFFLAETRAGETMTATIRNNLILNTNSSKVASGIVALVVSGATVNETCYGNSIVNCALDLQGGIGTIAIFPTDVVNITAKNNVVVEDGNQSGDCFAEQGAGTTNWTGSSHNVSSDATAKGTDAITGAAIGDVWDDIADDDAPFTPTTGGVLDPPDGANLYAAGVTEDAIGAERPSQGAHYRGGVEVFSGLYKVYGGAAPATVDYADMLASVRAGQTSVDIAGLGLAAGGTYCLAVRATSAAGVEETNTDRLARAVVDEFGQLQQPPLAAVEELTAELQADGTVIVGFTHMTLPGWAAPTRFEVLSDNGTGELNLAAPVATIDVTDPDVGDYEVALDPPGLPVKYSARACSAVAVGPPAPPVSVLSPTAPIAPQQM